jgi:hypothetical protein
VAERGRDVVEATLLGDRGQRLHFEVRYQRPASSRECFDDQQWLGAEVQFHAASFHAEASMYLRTEDFVSLDTDLARCLTASRGRVEFKTLEEQLRFTISLGDRGSVTVEGELGESPGMGNRLHFEFESARPELDRFTSEVREITVRCPVRGTP